MAQAQTSQGRLLSDATCHAVLSTTDVRRARDFWTQKVGLRVQNEDEKGVWLQAGNGTGLYIYERNAPPKAENTSVGFQVEDVAMTVQALRSHGIRFEDYDLGEVHTGPDGIAKSPDGKWQCAWFRDPDGNVCAVSNTVGRPD